MEDEGVGEVYQVLQPRESYVENALPALTEYLIHNVLKWSLRKISFDDI